MKGTQFVWVLISKIADFFCVTRHLSLSYSQSLELAEMELANQMAEHSPNFLPHDSRVYRQVKSILDNVIKGSR